MSACMSVYVGIYHMFKCVSSFLWLKMFSISSLKIFKKCYLYSHLHFKKWHSNFAEKFRFVVFILVVDSQVKNPMHIFHLEILIIFFSSNDSLYSFMSDFLPSNQFISMPAVQRLCAIQAPASCTPCG